MRLAMVYVCFFAAICASGCRSATERPNIIFILTDDQGYGDLGAHGNPFLRTPNMDQLYHESVRFTNFVVSPSCSPTRAALMTGKHEFRSGVTHTVTGRREMSLQSTTLAQVLRSAGYSTGIFGKWHLGSNGAYRPEKRGFDISVTSVDDTQRSHFDPVLLFNGEERQTRGFRENILFDEALQFIENNKEGPFFCYIPTYSPHAPLIAPQEHIDRNDGNVFYAMISNVDDNIGRLMQKLKELQLDENTVVILINDNGGTWGVDKYNAGMRGCKGTPWYGGTRAFSLWRWPGQLEPRNIEDLAAHVDLLPTLAELAGDGLREEMKKSLDGISLLPFLTEEGKALSDRMVISHKGRWPDGEGEVEAHKYCFCSVHWNNYLLVRSQTCGRDDCRGECRVFQRVIDGSTSTGYSKKADFHYAVNPRRLWALYNVKHDPAQQHDLASEYPEIVQKMSGTYEQWWKEVFPHIHREAEDPRWSQDYEPKQEK
ncbi:MAG: arylsulfatase [Bacteroidetes bacterium]|nr:MAG: arylsulfatase [Bacteroidota bacterium]